jgi:hypothetical protein
MMKMIWIILNMLCFLFGWEGGCWRGEECWGKRNIGGRVFRVAVRSMVKEGS